MYKGVIQGREGVKKMFKILLRNLRRFFTYDENKEHSFQQGTVDICGTSENVC